MTSQTDDLIINEDEEEDEDDPFSMAVKELSETNRQADEIARVRNIFFALIHPLIILNLI